MENKLDLKICWNITNKCNDKCKYCFRDQHNKALSFKNNAKIIKILPSLGVTSITFSGGEPLLHSGITELIKLSKSLNLETTLVTNSILLNKSLLFELEKHLDWLTLSLDSLDRNILKKLGRNPNHIDNITKTIDLIEYYELNFFIKINTILSKINIDSLKEVYNWVNNKKSIKRWKVLQFTPIRGESISNLNKFEISEYLFDKITKKLDLSNSRNDLRINFDNSFSIKNLYMVISPDGIVRKWSSDFKNEITIGKIDELSKSNIFNTFGIDYKKYNERLIKNKG